MSIFSRKRTEREKREYLPDAESSPYLDEKEESSLRGAVQSSYPVNRGIHYSSENNQYRLPAQAVTEFIHPGDPARQRIYSELNNRFKKVAGYDNPESVERMNQYSPQKVSYPTKLHPFQSLKESQVQNPNTGKFTNTMSVLNNDVVGGMVDDDAPWQWMLEDNPMDINNEIKIASYREAVARSKTRQKSMGLARVGDSDVFSGLSNFYSENLHHDNVRDVNHLRAKYKNSDDFKKWSNTIDKLPNSKAIWNTVDDYLQQRNFIDNKKKEVTRDQIGKVLQVEGLPTYKSGGTQATENAANLFNAKNYWSMMSTQEIQNASASDQAAMVNSLVPVAKPPLDGEEISLPEYSSIKFGRSTTPDVLEGLAQKKSYFQSNEKAIKRSQTHPEEYQIGLLALDYEEGLYKSGAVRVSENGQYLIIDSEAVFEQTVANSKKVTDLTRASRQRYSLEKYGWGKNILSQPFHGLSAGLADKRTTDFSEKYIMPAVEILGYVNPHIATSKYWKAQSQNAIATLIDLASVGSAAIGHIVDTGSYMLTGRWQDATQDVFGKVSPPAEADTFKDISESWMNLARLSPLAIDTEDSKYGVSHPTGNVVIDLNEQRKWLSGDRHAKWFVPRDTDIDISGKIKWLDGDTPVINGQTIRMSDYSTFDIYTDKQIEEQMNKYGLTRKEVQAMGIWAREAAKTLTKDRQVFFEPNQRGLKKDPYDRHLGTVSVEGNKGEIFTLRSALHAMGLTEMGFRELSPEERTKTLEEALRLKFVGDLRSGDKVTEDDKGRTVYDSGAHLNRRNVGTIDGRYLIKNYADRASIGSQSGLVLNQFMHGATGALTYLADGTKKTVGTAGIARNKTVTESLNSIMGSHHSLTSDSPTAYEALDRHWGVRWAWIANFAGDALSPGGTLNTGMKMGRWIGSSGDALKGLYSFDKQLQAAETAERLAKAYSKNKVFLDGHATMLRLWGATSPVASVSTEAALGFAFYNALSQGDRLTGDGLEEAIKNGLLIRATGDLGGAIMMAAGRQASFMTMGGLSKHADYKQIFGVTTSKGQHLHQNLSAFYFAAGQLPVGVVQEALSLAIIDDDWESLKRLVPGQEEFDGEYMFQAALQGVMHYAVPSRSRQYSTNVVEAYRDFTETRKSLKGFAELYKYEKQSNVQPEILRYERSQESTKEVQEAVAKAPKATVEIVKEVIPEAPAPEQATKGEAPVESVEPKVVPPPNILDQFMPPKNRNQVEGETTVDGTPSAQDRVLLQSTDGKYTITQGMLEKLEALAAHKHFTSQGIDPNLLKFVSVPGGPKIKISGKFVSDRDGGQAIYYNVYPEAETTNIMQETLKHELVHAKYDEMERTDDPVLKEQRFKDLTTAIENSFPEMVKKAKFSAESIRQPDMTPEQMDNAYRDELLAYTLETIKGTDAMMGHVYEAVFPPRYFNQKAFQKKATNVYNKNFMANIPMMTENGGVKGLLDFKRHWFKSKMDRLRYNIKKLQDLPKNDPRREEVNNAVAKLARSLDATYKASVSDRIDNLKEFTDIIDKFNSAIDPTHTQAMSQENAKAYFEALTNTNKAEPIDLGALGESIINTAKARNQMDLPPEGLEELSEAAEDVDTSTEAREDYIGLAELQRLNASLSRVGKALGMDRETIIEEVLSGRWTDFDLFHMESTSNLKDYTVQQLESFDVAAGHLVTTKGIDLPITKIDVNNLASRLESFRLWNKIRQMERTRQVAIETFTDKNGKSVTYTKVVKGSDVVNEATAHIQFVSMHTPSLTGYKDVLRSMNTFAIEAEEANKPIASAFFEAMSTTRAMSSDLPSVQISEVNIAPKGDGYSFTINSPEGKTSNAKSLYVMNEETGRYDQITETTYIKNFGRKYDENTQIFSINLDGKKNFHNTETILKQQVHALKNPQTQAYVPGLYGANSIHFLDVGPVFNFFMEYFGSNKLLLEYDTQNKRPAHSSEYVANLFKKIADLETELVSSTYLRNEAVVPDDIRFIPDKTGTVDLLNYDVVFPNNLFAEGSSVKIVPPSNIEVSPAVSEAIKTLETHLNTILIGTENMPGVLRMGVNTMSLRIGLGKNAEGKSDVKTLAEHLQDPSLFDGDIAINQSDMDKLNNIITGKLMVFIDYAQRFHQSPDGKWLQAMDVKRDSQGNIQKVKSVKAYEKYSKASVRPFNDATLAEYLHALRDTPFVSNGKLNIGNVFTQDIGGKDEAYSRALIVDPDETMKMFPEGHPLLNLMKTTDAGTIVFNKELYQFKMAMEGKEGTPADKTEYRTESGRQIKHAEFFYDIDDPFSNIANEPLNNYFRGLSAQGLSSIVFTSALKMDSHRRAKRVGDYAVDATNGVLGKYQADGTYKPEEDAPKTNIADPMGQLFYGKDNELGMQRLYLTGPHAARVMAGKSNAKLGKANLFAHYFSTLVDGSSFITPEGIQRLGEMAERVGLNFNGMIDGYKSLHKLFNSGYEIGMDMNNLSEAEQSSLIHLFKEMASTMDGRMQNLSLYDDLNYSEIAAYRILKDIVTNIDGKEGLDEALLLEAVFMNGFLFYTGHQNTLSESKIATGVGSMFMNFMAKQSDKFYKQSVPTVNLTYAPGFDPIGDYWRYVSHTLGENFGLAPEQVVEAVKGINTLYAEDANLEGKENVKALFDTLIEEGSLKITTEGYEIKGLDMLENGISKGSKFTSISKDAYDKLKINKRGSQGIQTKIPADAQTSIDLAEVWGILPESSRAQIAVDPYRQLEIVGSDNDADALAFSYNPDIEFLAQNIDWGAISKAKNVYLDLKKFMADNPTTQNVKIAGGQPVNLPSFYTQDKNYMKRFAQEYGYRYEDIAMVYKESKDGSTMLGNKEAYGGHPLHTLSPTSRRSHYVQDMIALAATTSNKIAQFFQIMPPSKFPAGISLNIPILKQSKKGILYEDGDASLKMRGMELHYVPINISYNEIRANLHNPMVKEGSVDRFNEISFIPDAAEMAAHIMVDGYATNPQYNESVREAIKETILDLLETLPHNVESFKQSNLKPSRADFDDLHQLLRAGSRKTSRNNDNFVSKQRAKFFDHLKKTMIVENKEQGSVYDMLTLHGPVGQMNRSIDSKDMGQEVTVKSIKYKMAKIYEIEPKKRTDADKAQLGKLKGQLEVVNRILNKKFNEIPKLSYSPNSVSLRGKALAKVSMIPQSVGAKDLANLKSSLSREIGLSIGAYIEPLDGSPRDNAGNTHLAKTTKGLLESIHNLIQDFNALSTLSPYFTRSYEPVEHTQGKPHTVFPWSKARVDQTTKRNHAGVKGIVHAMLEDSRVGRFTANWTQEAPLTTGYVSFDGNNVYMGKPDTENVEANYGQYKRATGYKDTFPMDQSHLPYKFDVRLSKVYYKPEERQDLMNEIPGVTSFLVKDWFDKLDNLNPIDTQEDGLVAQWYFGNVIGDQEAVAGLRTDTGGNTLFVKIVGKKDYINDSIAIPLEDLIKPYNESDSGYPDLQQFREKVATIVAENINAYENGSPARRDYIDRMPEHIKEIFFTEAGFYTYLAGSAIQTRQLTETGVTTHHLLGKPHGTERGKEQFVAKSVVATAKYIAEDLLRNGRRSEYADMIDTRIFDKVLVEDTDLGFYNPMANREAKVVEFILGNMLSQYSPADQILAKSFRMKAFGEYGRALGNKEANANLQRIVQQSRPELDAMQGIVKKLRDGSEADEANAILKLRAFVNDVDKNSIDPLSPLSFTKVGETIKGLLEAQNIHPMILVNYNGEAQPLNYRSLERAALVTAMATVQNKPSLSTRHQLDDVSMVEATFDKLSFGLKDSFITSKLSKSTAKLKAALAKQGTNYQDLMRNRTPENQEKLKSAVKHMMATQLGVKDDLINQMIKAFNDENYLREYTPQEVQAYYLNLLLDKVMGEYNLDNSEMGSLTNAPDRTDFMLSLMALDMEFNNYRPQDYTGEKFWSKDILKAGWAKFINVFARNNVDQIYLKSPHYAAYIKDGQLPLTYQELTAGSDNLANYVGRDWDSFDAAGFGNNWRYDTAGMRFIGAKTIETTLHSYTSKVLSDLNNHIFDIGENYQNAFRDFGIEETNHLASQIVSRLPELLSGKVTLGLKPNGTTGKLDLTVQIGEVPQTISSIGKESNLADIARLLQSELARDTESLTLLNELYDSSNIGGDASWRDKNITNALQKVLAQKFLLHADLYPIISNVYENMSGVLDYVNSDYYAGYEGVSQKITQSMGKLQDFMAMASLDLTLGDGLYAQSLSFNPARYINPELIKEHQLSLVDKALNIIAQKTTDTESLSIVYRALEYLPADPKEKAELVAIYKQDPDIGAEALKALITKLQMEEGETEGIKGAIDIMFGGGVGRRLKPFDGKHLSSTNDPYLQGTIRPDHTVEYLKGVQADLQNLATQVIEQRYRMEIGRIEALGMKTNPLIQEVFKKNMAFLRNDELIFNNVVSPDAYYSEMEIGTPLLVSFKKSSSPIGLEAKVFQEKAAVGQYIGHKADKEGNHFIELYNKANDSMLEVPIADIMRMEKGQGVTWIKRQLQNHFRDIFQHSLVNKGEVLPFTPSVIAKKGAYQLMKAWEAVPRAFVYLTHLKGMRILAGHANLIAAGLTIPFSPTLGYAFAVNAFGNYVKATGSTMALATGNVFSGVRSVLYYEGLGAALTVLRQGFTNKQQRLDKATHTSQVVSDISNHMDTGNRVRNQRVAHLKSIQKMLTSQEGTATQKLAALSAYENTNGIGVNMWKEYLHKLDFTKPKEVDPANIAKYDKALQKVLSQYKLIGKDDVVGLNGELLSAAIRGRQKFWRENLLTLGQVTKVIGWTEHLSHFIADKGGASIVEDIYGSDVTSRVERNTTDYVRGVSIGNYEIAKQMPHMNEISVRLATMFSKFNKFHISHFGEMRERTYLQALQKSLVAHDADGTFSQSLRDFDGNRMLKGVPDYGKESQRFFATAAIASGLTFVQSAIFGYTKLLTAAFGLLDFDEDEEKDFSWADEQREGMAGTWKKVLQPGYKKYMSGSVMYKYGIDNPLVPIIEQLGHSLLWTISNMVDDDENLLRAIESGNLSSGDVAKLADMVSKPGNVMGSLSLGVPIAQTGAFALNFLAAYGTMHTMEDALWSSDMGEYVELQGLKMLDMAIVDLATGGVPAAGSFLQLFAEVMYPNFALDQQMVSAYGDEVEGAQAIIAKDSQDMLRRVFAGSTKESEEYMTNLLKRYKTVENAEKRRAKNRKDSYNQEIYDEKKRRRYLDEDTNVLD